MTELIELLTSRAHLEIRIASEQAKDEIAGMVQWHVRSQSQRTRWAKYHLLNGGDHGANE